MSKMKRLRDVTVGVILGGVLFSGVSYAASATGIDVYFQPLKYFFDGVEKKAPADQQGFIYQGTTYVPLRFVSEALGKTVGYDGPTSSIYVGKQKEGQSTYLDEIPTLTKSENSYINYLDSFTTNMNETFIHSIKAGERTSKGLASKGQLNNVYILNGEYKSFEALIAPEWSWSQDSEYTLGSFKVIVDDKEVFNSGLVGSSITKPIQVKVDLTGALKLRIVFSDASGIALIQPKLTR